MKVTKVYCDCCNRELESGDMVLRDGFFIDVSSPDCIGLDFTPQSFGLKNMFGRITSDGMWELELCKDCLIRAIGKLQTLKDSTEGQSDDH